MSDAAQFSRTVNSSDDQAVNDNTATDSAAALDNAATTQAATVNRPRDELTRKKIEFISHILRQLDIVVYCHFSYVYFMDISLLRLIIRMIIHFNLFGERPPHFPPAQIPKRRSALGAIIMTTLISVLFHLFTAAPAAGEATGGYLHGGFIIDFIGQEGPISKFRLLVLDALILFLQMVMLTARFTKHELSDKLTDPRSTTQSQQPSTTTTNTQDINSEERGEDGTNQEELEREELLREEAPETEVDLFSGEIVAAELRLSSLWEREWEYSPLSRSRNSITTGRSEDLEAVRARLMRRPLVPIIPRAS